MLINLFLYTFERVPLVDFINLFTEAISLGWSVS